jgi:hypothetical protein
MINRGSFCGKVISFALSIITNKTTVEALKNFTRIKIKKKNEK